MSKRFTLGVHALYSVLVILGMGFAATQAVAGSSTIVNECYPTDPCQDMECNLGCKASGAIGGACVYKDNVGCFCECHWVN